MQRELYGDKLQLPKPQRTRRVRSTAFASSPHDRAKLRRFLDDNQDSDQKRTESRADRALVTAGTLPYNRSFARETHQSHLREVQTAAGNPSSLGAVGRVGDCRARFCGPRHAARPGGGAVRLGRQDPLPSLLLHGRARLGTRQPGGVRDRLQGRGRAAGEAHRAGALRRIHAPSKPASSSPWRFRRCCRRRLRSSCSCWAQEWPR